MFYVDLQLVSRAMVSPWDLYVSRLVVVDIARGDESLILWNNGIEYLEICLEHHILTPFFKISAVKSQDEILLQFQSFGISGLLHQWGKRCEKNYSSVRRYVADPDNAYPKRSITKLILKGAVMFDVVSYQFRCTLNYSKLVKGLSHLAFVKSFVSFIHFPPNITSSSSISLLSLTKMAFMWFESPRPPDHVLRRPSVVIEDLDLEPKVDAMMRELNGIPIALVARFGVISKNMDRIHVSRGG
ncbi:hypothetical protein Tco_1004227 [Tanacetum coccineum]|uniref:Uncharacterized protein n=1 Tax=Tanacetum coccineum TaxID=301880 RepID=A0ABQ5FCE7_9ASTR